MNKSERIASAESLLKTSLPPSLKVNSDHSSHIRISSPSDVDIELQFKDDSIDVRFGISGELLEFEDYQSEGELLSAIVRLVNEIIAEVKVAVRYKILFINAGGIYSIEDMEKLRTKKEFECMSWNGRFTQLKNEPTK